MLLSLPPNKDVMVEGGGRSGGRRSGGGVTLIGKEGEEGVYLLSFDVMVLNTAHFLCRFLRVKGHKPKALIERGM